jgi:hypothetical protein
MIAPQKLILIPKFSELKRNGRHLNPKKQLLVKQKKKPKAVPEGIPAHLWTSFACFPAFPGFLLYHYYLVVFAVQSNYHVIYTLNYHLLYVNEWANHWISQ